LALCFAAAFAAQQVGGGVTIDYASTFQENTGKAQAWKAKMAPEMQATLRGFQIKFTRLINE
jgi:hypothetical protein